MKKALITGASSGIGREIAKELSLRGYETILVARREENLRELASQLKTKSEVVCADLSDVHALGRIVNDYPEIDILVNNAGLGVYGEFDKTDFEKDRQMIDVNITALHFLMKKYLPHMKKNGGKILNVASSAAFYSGPLLASYYATKAYVLRLSNAVREELRREKAPVTISVLCPGPVETEFGDVAGADFALGAVSAQYVAKIGVEGLLSGKKTIVPTFVMKCGRLFSKLIPEALSVRVLYKVQFAKRRET